MIIDCLSKAIFAFVIYIVITLALFGVPKSLIHSYFLYKKQQDALKLMFPVMMILMGIFLTPCFLYISIYESFDILSLCCATSLLIIGLLPVISEKYTNIDTNIHNIGTILSIVLATVWVMLTTSWIIPIAVFLVMSIVISLTKFVKTIKDNYIFWLELFAFISIFIAIGCHIHISR